MYIRLANLNQFLAFVQLFQKFTIYCARHLCRGPAGLESHISGSSNSYSSLEAGASPVGSHGQESKNNVINDEVTILDTTAIDNWKRKCNLK